MDVLPYGNLNIESSEMNTPKVKKTPEQPESDEILASAIVKISKSMKDLSDSGLNMKAIVALIHDDTKIAKRTICFVINSLSVLSKRYCKK